MFNDEHPWRPGIPTGPNLGSIPTGHRPAGLRFPTQLPPPEQWTAPHDSIKVGGEITGKNKFGDSPNCLTQKFYPIKHLQQFQIILQIMFWDLFPPFSHWHFTQVENQCYRVQPITIQPGRCVASTCEPLNACERTRLHDATTSGKKSCGPTVSFKDYRDLYWSMSQKYVWRLLVLDWLE